MGLFDDLGSLFSNVGDLGANAATATLPQAQPQTTPQASTFLGGLMGSPDYDPAARMLGAAGRSLMTSPSNNPLRDFSANAQQVQGSSTQGNLIARLRAMGLTDQQIVTMLQGQGGGNALLGGLGSLGGLGGSFGLGSTSNTGGESAAASGNFGAPASSMHFP